MKLDIVRIDNFYEKKIASRAWKTWGNAFIYDGRDLNMFKNQW